MSRPEEIRYVLEWNAAARPPVHPYPMSGRQSFTKSKDAIEFFEKQAIDAEFVSLTKETTTYEDVSYLIEKK